MKTIAPFKIVLVMFLIFAGTISNTYAQELQSFQARETRDNIRGNLVMTGNDIVGVKQRGSTSFDPNTAFTLLGEVSNGDYTTAYIDVDSDPTTFSSSEADLRLDDPSREACSQLVYAGLYWSANYYMARSGAVRNFSDDEISSVDSDDETNVALTINNGSLADMYRTRATEFSSDNSDLEFSPVSSYLVVAQPTNGCGITNGTALSGNIAVVQEGGSCSLREKVVNAEAAGAVGVVIVSDTGLLPRLTGNGTTINIPSVSIGNDDINGGNLITALQAQTNVVLGTISTIGADWIFNLPADDPRKVGPADFQSIKFKVPGGAYVDITPESTRGVVFDGYAGTATNIDPNTGNPNVNANDEVQYVCYKDVTSLLDAANPFGTYTVANMNATQGYTPGEDGACGGWMLIAIYEDPEESAKFISTSDGYVQIFSGGADVDFNYTGFTTLSGTQPIDVKYAAAGLEGDRGLELDALSVQNTLNAFVPLGEGTNDNTDVNATNNFFASTISINHNHITARNPASTNTMGFDADIFDLNNDGNLLIGNDQSSATFRLSTDQDRYSVFFNAFSVTIIEPELRIIKRVFDTDGTTEITNQNVELGDELFYDLEIENVGNEDFVNNSVVITDILPANTNLLGVVDATLPPGVTYTETTPGTLVFNIPSSLVETDNDGEGDDDAPIFIRFRAQLVNSCEALRDACSDVITNSATAVYTGARSGTTSNTLSSNELGVCGNTDGEASNILVNVPACSQEVTFCNNNLTLVAGQGYDRYTWTGPGITTPIVQELATNSTPYVFNVPSPQTGTYVVVKEDTNPADGTCMTLTEEFVVEDFRDIANPVLDYVNGTTVVTEDCSGLPIPQILLCGDQTLLLETNFVNLQNISWQRLSPGGSCISDPNDPCSLLSGDCTDTNWVQEPNGDTSSFTVSVAGDYRILAEFEGGCFIPFYFSVFKNDYQPELDMNPIECGNDGSVTVTNVPTNFAFSLTQGGPYNNTTGVFAIPPGSGGDVTVYAIDTTFPGCEYTATINVPEIIPTFSVTGENATCINDDNGTGFGSIRIAVTAGSPEYQYTISSPALGAANPIIVPNSSANNGNYTQDNLPPGIYSVEVISNRPTPECIFNESITLDPPPAFDAEVVLLAPETCESGALVQINVLNGSGNYRYADSGGSFQLSNIFEIPAPADPTATYTFFVSDQDVLDGSTPACIIEVSIDNITAYEPIVIDNIAVTQPACPGDSGQIQVDVSPTVAGRTYTYQLLDCSADPDCGNADQSTWDTTVWTIVDQVGPTINQTITFTGVADGNSYAVSVLHNNTTPPGTTPAEICPVRQSIFTITSPTDITADVGLERPLSCIVGSEDAIIRIENIASGSGTYEWSFDNVNFTNITADPTDILVSTAGSYTVYIRNQATDDCAIPFNVTVPDLIDVTDITFTTPGNSNCSAQTFNVTATALPAGPTYTYSVTPAPVSGNSNTGVFRLTRGIVYTFTATNTDNQCSYSEDFTENTIPQIQITSATETSPIVCVGDNNGAFSFSVANSTTFDYTVRGPAPGNGVVTSGTSSTTPVVIQSPAVPLVAGTYTIEVTDTSLTPSSANCTDSATVTITEPADPLSFTTTSESSDCGADTGTITVTAIGGRGNYQYRIVSSGGTVIVDYPNTNNVFTGLAVDTYTIFVRDGSDPTTACEVNNTEVVDQFASPTIALATGGDPCFDGIDQASQWITITPGINPPLGPFEYILDRGTGPETPVAVTFLPAPNDDTFEIDNLAPGTYTVFVRNTNTQCITGTETFTINPELTITAALDKDIDCNGDAIISYTAAGGSLNYVRFDLYTPGTPNTLVQSNIGTSPYSDPVLTPGDYIILVEDDQGCTAFSNPVTVTTYDALDANHTFTNPACPNETGTITVNVTAGQGPFTYVLDGTTTIGSTGDTTVTFTNVAVGTHTVVITDGSGAAPPCIFTISDIILTNPDPIVATIDEDFRILNCTATPDAQAQVTAITGGSGTYEWSLDGTTFTSVTTLPFTIDFATDGSYTLSIRNQATDDCVQTFPITIDPLLEVDSVTVTPGDQDCSAQTTEVTLSASPAVTAPVIYEFDVTPDPATNTGSTGFDIAVNYTFTNGVTYRVTARRSDTQCTNFVDFNQPVLDEIAITSATQSQAVTCNGANDGELSFTVDTTTFPNFTFEVEGPSPATTVVATGTFPADPLTVTGLAPGTYTITVTDANGTIANNCSATETVIITEPIVLSASALVDPALTCVQNATITVTATGGNGGYQYELVNSGGTTVAGPQTSNVFSVGTADTYTINITDSESCTASTTAIVTDPTPVTATVEGTSDRCFDPTNQASLDITVNTGTAPYTYTVNGGSSIAIVGSTFTAGGLTPGAYTIVITDANGCDFTINETIQPQLTIAASLLKDLDCTASPDAQIQVVTTGGNGGEVVTVDLDGSTGVPNFVTIPASWGAGPIYNVDTAGTYQFRVRDTEGCEAISADITVTPAPDPVASATADDVTCFGQSDGSVEITVDTTIGTGPYEIDFNGLGFSNQTTYGNLIAGTYNYTVRDAKGCTDTFSIIVSQPANVVIGAETITNIGCDATGNTLGQIEFTGITGGTPPYIYTLLNPDNTLASTTTAPNPTLATANDFITFSGLAFGDYIVRVQDNSGCIYDFPRSIANIASFTINATATGNCIDGVTATINVSGGVGPFEIREFTPGGTEPYLPLNPGPTTHVITGLPFDSPLVFEIRDRGNNDCSDIATLPPPTNPSTINIALVENNVTCNGAADGSIDYTITGYQGTELTYEVYRTNDLTTDLSGGLTFTNANPQTVVLAGTATGNISTFGPGDYLFRVIETSGVLADPCNASIPFTIEESATPLSYDGTNIIDGNCNALSQGVVSVSGGTAPYEFVVVEDTFPNSGAYSNSNVVILDQNVNLNWDLYIRDANGCVIGPFDLTASVTPDPTIDNISAVVDPCVFDGSFEFTVTATGQSQLEFGIDDGDTGTADAPIFVNGTPTGNPNEYEYTYTVSGPSVDQYTITVRDQNGCPVTDAVIIHPELIVDADFSTDPTCFNSNSGTVTATVTGGSNNSANWTVVLLDGTGTPTGIAPTFTAPNIYVFANVPTGDYEVTVTDTNPVSTCTASDTFSRAALVDPIISTSVEEISCIGASDGEILVSITAATNGFDPYTYELYENNGGTQGVLIATQVDNPLFTGLSFDAQPAPYPTAGEYLVIVRSRLGCEDQEAVTLVNPTVPIVDISNTDYGCTGDTVNLPVITLDNFRDGAGTPYRIEYTDPSGNTVGPIDPATLDTDGTTVGVQIIANEAGNYTFTVYDANNCPNTLAPYNIPAFPIMTDAVINVGAPITCTTNIQEVTVTVTGGLGDFNFEEVSGAVPADNNVPSGGATTTSATFSLPGVVGTSYQFRVTDNGTGCSILTPTYTIAPYDTIEASIAVVPPAIQCFDDDTGSITLDVTGITGAYEYTVTNTTTGTVTGPIPENTSSGTITISGLESGNIQVNVVDLATNCDDDSNTVFIAEPEELTLAPVSNDNGFCTSDGRVIVEANGGTPPYTFTADDGTNPVFTNNTGDFSLPGSIAGITYTITVTDANSCTSNPASLTETVFVTENPVLAPLTVDDVCTHDGSYVITATGTSNIASPPGTGALRFQLDSGTIEDANLTLTSTEITVSTPGTYTVTAYDENNCPSNSQSVTIFPQLTASADFTADPTCRDFDGTITVTVNGGTDFNTNPTNFTFELDGTDSTGSPFNVIQTGVGSNIFNNISPGNYTITITDINDPTITTPCSITIGVTPPDVPLDPIVSATGTVVSCVGASDGTVTATLDPTTDDDAPYTYQLFVNTAVPPAVTFGAQVGVDQIDNPVFIGVPTGDYVVVVTSDRLCSGQATVNVPNATQVTVVPSQSAYSCDTSDNSSIFPVITLTIENGTPPYSVSYVTPSGNTVTDIDVADANGNPADGVQYEILADEEGDYVITVTDSKGCALDPTPTITETVNPFPIMTNPAVAVVTDITCAVDEEVQVSVQGGSGDFLFEMVDNSGNVINPPAPVNTPAGTNTANFTLPRPLGIYTFRITDEITMCTIEVTHEIDEFDFIEVAAVQQTPETCLGDADGEISITITGYTGTFDFQVYEEDGVTAVPGALGNGNATTDPFVFTLPITLAQGTYIVGVTETADPLCTELSNVVNIIGPAAPIDVQISPINTQESCVPGSDGSFQAFTTGEQGVVTYTIAPAAQPANTTGLFENLPNGTYTVTAVDANGCTDDATITINAPNPILVDPIPDSSVTCFGDTNGSISITANGGQGPGTYLYTLTFPDGTTTSGPQDIGEFNNLGPGTYTVTVSDNLNCSATTTATIDEPNEVTVSIDTVTEVECGLDTINVTISGTSDGTITQYYYVDQNGNEVPNGGSGTFIGLTAGEYLFFVEDNNGCRSQLAGPVPVIPINPIVIVLDERFANINCFNEETGIIDATVSGGIGDYVFDLVNNTTGQTWPPQSTSEFRDLPPGNYTYTVRTDRNCIDQEDFDIINPPEFLNIPPDATDVLCFGEDNGQIIVFAQGGTPPYSFAISTDPDQFFNDDSDDDPNQHTFTMLAPGNYQVFAQDSEGCPQVYDVTIGEPTQLTANVDGAITPETCFGDSDGAVTIAITGGIAPYFTSITNVDGDFVQDQLTYTGLPGGITTIYVRDTNDCTFELPVFIPEGVMLNADLNPRLECPEWDYTDPENPVMTQGPRYFVDFVLGPNSVTTDIEYMLTGINGTPDPAISLNNNGIFEVTPGEYEGTMEHSGGCIELVGTIIIEEYMPLTVPVATMTNNPQDPNEYMIEVSGGIPPYTYYVTFEDEGVERELTSNIFTIRQTGNYIIRVVDSSASNCEIIGTQLLTYINIRIPNYFTPDRDDPTTEEDDRYWYPRQISPNDSDPFFFENIEVKVFDRYGRLLKEFQGDQKGWSGIYQGSMLPSGDYWYTVILNDIDNREFTGHFTLYRM
ncbi:T9SS type B sorting domain-containing protein [Aquimarina sp. MMG016]|uniref:T9SS type B sorting domain-containing protein n=1 Tax=Aquimarina sp. MMG016 TaxID=2822690 RepID=UPI001B3A2CF6|nr:T9SS type B sorting domain-containing protein [Aquimarina sp. MMG016]MBQ4820053.1 T9SS type B sorting domain-containing protein [Aquimarina sp. MMG016]